MTGREVGKVLEKSIFWGNKNKTKIINRFVERPSKKVNFRKRKIWDGRLTKKFQKISSQMSLKKH